MVGPNRSVSSGQRATGHTCNAAPADGNAPGPGWETFGLRTRPSAPRDILGLRKHRAMQSEVAFDAFLELLDLTHIDAGDVIQWDREHDAPGMAGKLELLGQSLHDVKRELPLQHA